MPVEPFPGLTLMSAAPGPHHYPLHSHDGFALIGLASGSKRFTNSGREVLVTAPEIAVANPGEPHGCGPVDGAPWSHKTWYASRGMLEEVLGIAPDRLMRLRGPTIRDDALARTLAAAHDACHRTSGLERETIAAEALGTIAERHLDTDAPPVRVDDDAHGRRAAIYEALLLADLPGRRVTLAQLAAKGGVHVNQVIRDFRRRHGMTPGAFLRVRRLERVKMHIREGKRTTDIASELGFADQSHLTRQFREAYGMTPGAFRKLAAGDPDRNPL